MRCAASLVIAVASLPCLLVGCQLSPVTPAAADASPAAPCPGVLRDPVQLSASAMPLSLPASLSAGTQAHELVARRILLAVSAARGAAGTRVLGSELTISVVGGTFAGSASAPVAHTAEAASRWDLRPRLREVANDRALEVIPGRLSVAPFLAGSRLHAQTLALDVALAPGALPVSKLTLDLPPLWRPDGRPVSPQALPLAIKAEQHFTVFDIVKADVDLVLEGREGGHAGKTWRCSYETPLLLLDHEAVLPALWDLRVARPGLPERWLALFNPATGPFRALFTDAAAAHAFASWLQATGASRVGPYQVGLFEADQGGSEANLPADRDIARSFAPAADDELQGLAVERFGES